ncbi:MAG: tetratricopeptide repeat protein [Proteobacteria bacterium]|nr:tetratricopeptide repeat protein [Pseudomonadota bacterium]
MTRAAPDFVVEAGRLLTLRRVPQAIGRCRQGLLGAPECVSGRLLLASALFAAAQYDEVLAQLEAVAAFDAKHPLCELLRGETLLHLGSLARAEQALLRARSLGAPERSVEVLSQALAAQRERPVGEQRRPAGGTSSPPEGAAPRPAGAPAKPSADGAPTAEIGARALVALPLEDLDALLDALDGWREAPQPVPTGEIETQEVTSVEQPTGLHGLRPAAPAAEDGCTGSSPAAAASGADSSQFDAGDTIRQRAPLAVLPTAVVPDAARHAAAHDLAFQQTMRGPLKPPPAAGAGAPRVLAEAPRALAPVASTAAELSAQEIETVSRLLEPQRVAASPRAAAAAARHAEAGPIDLTDSAIELELAEGSSVESAEQWSSPLAAVDAADGVPVMLHDAEISVVLPAQVVDVVATDGFDRPSLEHRSSPSLRGGADRAAVPEAQTGEGLAAAAPERTEALARSALVPYSDDLSASQPVRRDAGSAAAAARVGARSAGPRSPEGSQGSARSWGSRSEEASAGPLRASSLGRSAPGRRFRAPSAAMGRRSLPTLWTLIAGDRSAQRWALVLIGCIAVVTVALLVGFLVRGYRLRQLSTLRWQAARLRLERGNLGDFAAAAQLLGAGAAGAGGTALARHLQARVVAAIPVEFGDPLGSARTPSAGGAWVDDEQAAAAVYGTLGRGQLDQAEQLVARALRLFPESSLLLYLHGRLALVRGEPDRAQQWLQQAAQRAPRDLLIAAALGDALRQRGEASLALQHYQRTLQLNPEHVASALGRARCLLELDRLADAARQLRVVLHGELRRAAARGQHAWAYLLLGTLHRKARDPDEARRDLQQARALAPASDPVFLEALAWALLGVDRVGEAETAAAAAATLMPGRPSVALLSATVFLREGRLHEAGEQAQRASALDEAALVNAEIELGLGRVEQAARQLQSRPVVASSAAGQLLAARVGAARGEVEDALAVARELAADRPNQVQALTVVGRLLLGEGRLAEARHALEQALRHDADALEPRLALVEVMLGEHAIVAARDELVRLVRAYPWSTIATKRLAELDLGRNDLLPARKAAEALLQRVPKDDEAQLLLVRVRVAGYEFEAAEQQLLKVDRGAAGQRDLAVGRLALAADDGRRAVAHLLAALRVLPHESTAWSLLVQAYLAVDRPDRARKAWQSMLRRFPRAWRTYETQGRLELSAARPHAAVQALRQAIALAANQVRFPAEEAGSEVLLAVALQDAGDARQALEALSRAETACPLCPEPPFRRGLALQELRRQREAVGALVRAVRLSPRMPQVYYALGKLYQGLGRRAEALRMYRQYLELGPPEELADDVRRALAELQR